VWTDVGHDCPSWSGDLNWLEGTPGTHACINGAGLGNAPDGNWYFIEYTRHINPGNYYETQRATGMTGGVAGVTYVRSQQSATAGTGWSAWTKMGGGGVGTPYQTGAWFGPLAGAASVTVSCPAGFVVASCSTLCTTNCGYMQQATPSGATACTFYAPSGAFFGVANCFVQ